MKRRNFSTLISGAAAGWPIATWALQGAMPILGFVHSASESYFAPFLADWLGGLKEAGYVDGRNVAIEYRYAEGHSDRLPALVNDLIGRHAAVLFAAGGTEPAKAAKTATTEIPIVFVSAADPLRTGLVQSLARPGGNVTGISLLASALSAKKLELLRQLVPRASLIGSLINPSYPDAELQAAEFQFAAKSLGVQSAVLYASTDADLDNAFSTLEQRHDSALVVANDPFFGGRRDQLVALAARHSVPAIFFQKEFVANGGLVSYGPSFADGYRQAGVYLGKILNGEKPADLPILQPTKFELVINLKTAKALGIAVPPTLLALADEVIE
jgi:putative tryptophan/tyrosine transport system substrate-binding protein